MKKVDIEGKTFIIYEDGSIRIPVKDTHLCLDFMDIAFLYEKSKKALLERNRDRKNTRRSNGQYYHLNSIGNA